jgi:hypothetical protein
MAGDNGSVGIVVRQGGVAVANTASFNGGSGVYIYGGTATSNTAYNNDSSEEFMGKLRLGQLAK